MKHGCEINLRTLLGLCVARPRLAIKRWWLTKLEHHYLICAEVERAKEKQARTDARYYEMRAVLTRADISSI